MPTSDTQVRDAFRHIYGLMIDDSPLPPELEELSTLSLQSTTGRKSWSGILAAAGAFVIVVAAVGGVAWFLGATTSPDDADSAPPGAEAPTTTVPAALARVTVVFRPGELTDAEWDAFTGILRTYATAAGFVPIDEATARQQARAQAARDPDTLSVFDEHPYVVTGYAQVEFADREEAFAFQEEVGGLDFVVAAVGSNGPRLGGGYGSVPELSLEDDDVRSALWLYFYNLDLPDEIRDRELDVTTTIARECMANPGSPLDVAGEPDWRQYADYFPWTDVDGCLVRIDVLAERAGPDHCGWEDSRVLITGPSLRVTL
jgi:hypothetical protein